MNTSMASRGATMAVDWEQRIDFARLRGDRLARARRMLDASDLGALVLTRFPAEELLVAGKTYVQGADLLDETRSPSAV
jgi:hypothetical protein